MSHILFCQPKPYSGPTCTMVQRPAKTPDLSEGLCCKVCVKMLCDAVIAVGRNKYPGDISILVVWAYICTWR